MIPWIQGCMKSRCLGRILNCRDHKLHIFGLPLPSSLTCCSFATPLLFCSCSRSPIPAFPLLFSNALSLRVYSLKISLQPQCRPTKKTDKKKTLHAFISCTCTPRTNYSSIYILIPQQPITCILYLLARLFFFPFASFLI